jgi:hypothetical protein
VTSGDNDEEAAWLDLIAHYDAPADAAGATPWPEREGLAEADNAPIPGGSQVTRSPKTTESPGAPETPGAPQAKARPAPADPPFSADLTAPDLTGPEAGQAPAPPPAKAPEMQEEHYFPPPPPPLPKLDPVTKGAWAALFGGPAYLLIATAVGWTVPAVAAFFAIGAFVGGFAILVMRMGDEPRDGDGPDDGAVV